MIQGIIDHCAGVIDLSSRSVLCVRAFMHDGNIPNDIFDTIICIYVNQTIADIYVIYEKHVYVNAMRILQHQIGYIEINWDIINRQNMEKVLDHQIWAGATEYHIYPNEGLYIFADDIAHIFINDDELPDVIRLIASWRPMMNDMCPSHIKFSAWE